MSIAHNELFDFVVAFFKGFNVKALQILNDMETNGAKTPNIRENKKIKNLKNEIVEL